MPANGSTLQPSPASTTSICELKCTVGAGAAAVETGDHIGARVAVGVAGRAFAAHEFDFEAALLQPRAKIFGAGLIGFAGRVDGRKADQVGGQRDEVVDAVVDGFQELFVHRPI